MKPKKKIIEIIERENKEPPPKREKRYEKRYTPLRGWFQQEARNT